MTTDESKQDTRLAMGPVPVARLLARATRPLMGRIQAATARLALDWPQIVGPALASVTAPDRLSGGKDGRVLTIRAAGPVALELQHLAPQLVERINAHAGPGLVSRLRFIQAPRGAAEPQAPAPAPPPRRLPPEAAARVEQSVADLPEGPLRDALVRLGRAVASR